MRMRSTAFHLGVRWFGCVSFLSLAIFRSGVWPHAVVLVVVASLALTSEKSLFSFWNVCSGKSGVVDGSGEEGVSRGTHDDFIEVLINAMSASYVLIDRETEVLYLAVQGKTNSQIGRDMFISEGTVKAHLSHIYQKFGIHTRKELMSLFEKKIR